MPSHRQAAIDLNHLTGDVAGVIGKKKAGNARHFVRFGKAAEGNLFENFTAVSFIECAGHVGGNKSERQRIDSYFPAGNLLASAFVRPIIPALEAE